MAALGPPGAAPDGSVGALPPAGAPADVEAVETVDEAMELVEVAGVLAGPGEDQLRELDFLIQQGLLDDAAKLLQKLRDAFADHPDVLARQAMLKARGWDEDRRGTAVATAAELFSEEEQFFDLAAELEKELAEEEMVAEATGSGKGTDVSIEDLFKEFQRGVAEQVEEEDFDTHFNLGLAYREMGLLDEAIGEFQLSAKSSDYLVESASMIGACYIEKGLPEQGGRVVPARPDGARPAARGGARAALRTRPGARAGGEHHGRPGMLQRGPGDQPGVPRRRGPSLQAAQQLREGARLSRPSHPAVEVPSSGLTTHASCPGGRRRATSRRRPGSACRCAGGGGCAARPRRSSPA